jgi:hypothetical protein
VARGRVLKRLEDAARLHGHGVADGIDIQHPVHATERQHDAAVHGPRRGTAHQAGVATLRNDGNAVVVAELDDSGDFRGAGRTHDRRGLPRQFAAPVGHEGLLVLLVQDQAFVADDGPQAVENG